MKRCLLKQPIRESCLASTLYPFLTPGHSWIVVADYRKNSTVLGTNVRTNIADVPHRTNNTCAQWKQGIPIEVASFAYAKVLHNLATLGSPAPKLRMAKMKAGPIVSDNGNFIIDAPFPEEQMKDPLTVS